MPMSMSDHVRDHVRARRRRAKALPPDARLVRYVAEPDGSASAAVRLEGQVLDVDPATAERRFGSDAGWYEATGMLQGEWRHEFYGEPRSTPPPSSTFDLPAQRRGRPGRGVGTEHPSSSWPSVGADSPNPRGDLMPQRRRRSLASSNATRRKKAASARPKKAAPKRGAYWSNVRPSK
jgi:hypothetical protein